LLSGLSKEENQSIVQLIRIADGEVIAKWIPDWSYIHRHTTTHRFAPKGNLKNYLAVHPLLLNDGSLIFNVTGSLVRLPLCSSKPSWVLNYPYHHSIELAPTGNSIWAPSVTELFATDNHILKDQLRDDSLSEVSLDGRVLQNLSFSKILAENNMTAHMLGSTGFTYNLDPLHINQITPALSNGRYWERGDLLISARHTSTVYLYRPTTGKIIWHQQGPWLNQHSAYFYNDHGIVVFGNDVYGRKLRYPFIYKEGHNQIYLYDFKTAQTNKLHSDALGKAKPVTITEGRSRVFDDKSIFIEETNNARILKLNASGQLMWSYINTYDKDYLGAISWSRYLTHEELHATVNISSMKCKK
jgi:outer membrane protein assembly factor BamB